MTMILDDLYASEIDFRIATNWDAGWSVALGNEYGGFVAETNVDSFDGACEWLRAAAIQHYPNSEFARTAGRT
jgi:hypothetical protein